MDDQSRPQNTRVASKTKTASPKIRVPSSPWRARAEDDEFKSVVVAVITQSVVVATVHDQAVGYTDNIYFKIPLYHSCEIVAYHYERSKKKKIDQHVLHDEHHASESNSQSSQKIPFLRSLLLVQ